MNARATRGLGLAFLVASIVLSASGQLAMKAGMQALHRLAADAHFAPTAASLAHFAPAIAWTAGGLAAYACSLLAWLAVLVRYPLSYAYPLLGLSYVLVYLGATHWARLMEPATPLRTLGTLLIIAGVGLVSLGNEHAATAPGDDSRSAADGSRPGADVPRSPADGSRPAADRSRPAADGSSAAGSVSDTRLD